MLDRHNKNDFLFIALSVIVLISFNDRCCVFGYTMTEETTLQNTLTTGYINSLRPGTDRSQPVQVNVSFCLRSIKEFEETSGKFCILGDFELSWVDERLAWTPSSNGDINVTTFPQSKVWVPDLICTNPFNSLGGLSIDQVIVQYDYTGLATWMPGNLFESTCDADVTYYPYDSQTCTLVFMAWGYTTSDVILNPTTDVSRLEFYTENGLWVLKSSRVYTEAKGTNMQTINLEYTLKRRATFYLINLLMPMCIIGMLHIIVFQIPADSGERIGYSVTILLALTVYMSIVADTLPEASEPRLSILSFKLMGDMMVGSIMMVLTIVGLKFYHKKESKPVPKLWVNFTKGLMCVPCKKSKSSVTDISGDSPEKADGDSDPETVKWPDVAKAFDRFCNIAAIMMNVILNMLFIITVSMAP